MAVQPSVEAAAAWLEPVDVDDRDDIFGADGTLYQASVVDGVVRLTATSDKRPDELRRRLRGFLSHPTVGLDPDLADEPSEVAIQLADRQRAQTWPRWPKWLHGLAHRDG